MELIDLRNAVDAHSGTFHCVQIHNKLVTKEVKFLHVYDPPAALEEEIPIGKLRDFYETFGNLLLYHDKTSDDAAFYIASPKEWDLLDGHFRPWLEGLDEDEEKELLPDWIDDCIVIGEIPQSGNYLLMPRSGEKGGFVFEFEHDGFEFIEYAADLEQFTLKILSPSEPTLTNMASHMRFIEEEDYSSQWWIAEMRDSHGNVVCTSG